MNIRNLFTPLFKHLRIDTRVDPTRDWLLLLTGAAIALVGIIAWNAWTFGTVAQGGVIGSVATSTPSAFDRSTLDNIRTIFVNRAAEEAKYRTGAYRYADPSQ